MNDVRPGLSLGFWRAFLLCLAFDLIVGAGVVGLVRWVT